MLPTKKTFYIQQVPKEHFHCHHNHHSHVNVNSLMKSCCLSKLRRVEKIVGWCYLKHICKILYQKLGSRSLEALWKQSFSQNYCLEFSLEYLPNLKSVTTFKRCHITKVTKQDTQEGLLLFSKYDDRLDIKSPN